MFICNVVQLKVFPFADCIFEWISWASIESRTCANRKRPVTIRSFRKPPRDTRLPSPRADFPSSRASDLKCEFLPCGGPDGYCPVTFWPFSARRERQKTTHSCPSVRPLMVSAITRHRSWMRVQLTGLASGNFHAPLRISALGLYNRTV